MKSNRTKACDISMKVKRIVWERDEEHCIICGRTGYGVMPNAHYISRANGGLGIEQNIVTLCFNCHRNFDQSKRHKEYEEKIKEYLKSKYHNWEEYNLVYRKYNW